MSLEKMNLKWRGKQTKKSHAYDMLERLKSKELWYKEWKVSTASSDMSFGHLSCSFLFVLKSDFFIVLLKTLDIIDSFLFDWYMTAELWQH